jgi:[amino group carrier protein]-L-2-aminoadipate/L-glutamate 6-kinase
MLVCKVGGSEGIDLDLLCDDVARLVRGGTRMVLVHGGSHETNRVAEALGHPPRFLTSPSGFTSRHTDKKTLEIFEMVYCGSVNKGIVERLQRRGVNAVGLSGLDGRTWEGPRKKVLRALEEGRVVMVRDSYTGVVERVNTALLATLLEAGFLPVLTPPAASDEGEAINVDGDRASAATAAALKADTLLLLSNVPGFLSRFPDETSLVRELQRGGLEEAIELAGGRMKIKLLGAREALDGGVGRVVLGDARVENPVSRALEGRGTVIR